MTSVTPTVDLGGVLPESVYVGLRVEDSASGVRVTEVGTNASDAGIQVGDMITAVEFVQITTAEQFATEMNRLNPFTSINLQLRRAGVILVNLSLGPTDFVVATAAP